VISPSCRLPLEPHFVALMVARTVGQSVIAVFIRDWPPSVVRGHNCACCVDGLLNLLHD
jgi:hypothetical protein